MAALTSTAEEMEAALLAGDLVRVGEALNAYAEPSINLP